MKEFSCVAVGFLFHFDLDPSDPARGQIVDDGTQTSANRANKSEDQRESDEGKDTEKRADETRRVSRVADRRQRRKRKDEGEDHAFKDPERAIANGGYSHYG